LEWSAVGDHVIVDRPNILTRHRSLIPAGNDLAAQDAVDIVANEIGVDLAEQDAFPIRLEQGVFDTNAEAFLGSGPVTGSTAEAYAASRDWLAISSDQRPVLANLTFSDDLRRRVSEDLDSGYMVVAPKTPIQKQNETSAGWWRIDPRSGDTLGMSANGWGGSATEGASLITMAVNAVAGFTFEYALCQGISQGINGVKVLNERYFGGWHPSWTMGAARSEDPTKVFHENNAACLIQAIVAGFAATLPLVMITIKAKQARMAARLMEEAAAKEAEGEAASVALKKYEQDLMELPGMNEPMPVKNRVVVDSDADAAHNTMAHHTNPYDPRTDPVRNTQVPEPRTAVTDPASLIEKAKRIEAAQTNMERAQRELDKSMNEMLEYRKGRPDGLLPRADYDFLTDDALMARAELDYREYSEAVSELEHTIAPTLKKSGPPKPLSPRPPTIGNSNETLPEIAVGSAGASNALGGGPQ
jgi:hypothetical protein